jgi:hypothetical protein
MIISRIKITIEVYLTNNRCTLGGVMKNKLIIILFVILIIILIISFAVKKISDMLLFDLNKYENLKTEDIASIQDEELVFAVMSWMWSKFNSDWSNQNQYNVISSLPKACQNIYSVYTIEAEVNNGGFNQCYFNSSKEFTKMAESGFKEIGAVNFADIMIRANLIYTNIKDDLEKFNDGTFESFSKSYQNNPLNELDDEFIKMYEREPLDKLCIEYISVFCNYKIHN